jgi:hypothetical protein
MGIIDKTTIANVVAGACILTGLFYAFWVKDTQLVTSIALAAIGYLFGRATAKVEAH